MIILGKHHYLKLLKIFFLSQVSRESNNAFVLAGEKKTTNQTQLAMWPVEIYGQTTVSNELCSSESKSYIEYSLFIGLTVCEHLLFSEVK